MTAHATPARHPVPARHSAPATHPAPARHSAPATHRLAPALALLLALVAAALLGPAIVAPSHVERAAAATHTSCDITGCADARAARSGWQSLGFPTSRGWYRWSGGEYNFAGGRYNNYEGQLPSSATYYEYDVNPRAYGAHRDAYRIVVNRTTGATWYSPDHYADFYRL